MNQKDYELLIPKVAGFCEARTALNQFVKQAQIFDSHAWELILEIFLRSDASKKNVKFEDVSTALSKPLLKRVISLLVNEGLLMETQNSVSLTDNALEMITIFFSKIAPLPSTSER